MVHSIDFGLLTNELQFEQEQMAQVTWFHLV